LKHPLDLFSAFQHFSIYPRKPLQKKERLPFRKNEKYLASAPFWPKKAPVVWDFLPFILRTIPPNPL
jgi:hypothetical protein